MNEEPTKGLPNSMSFEERVFARFDAVDARLTTLESRAYDTKPIWERALKAIMDTGLEMGEVKSKVGAIDGKVDVIEGKVQLLEKEVGAMKTSIRNELVDVRRELRHYVGERLDLILKFLLEDREDIRDAEARIRELESKFA
jgi:hypothetical protein